MSQQPSAANTATHSLCNCARQPWSTFIGSNDATCWPLETAVAMVASLGALVLGAFLALQPGDQPTQVINEIPTALRRQIDRCATTCAAPSNQRGLSPPRRFEKIG